MLRPRHAAPRLCAWILRDLRGVVGATAEGVVAPAESIVGTNDANWHRRPFHGGSPSLWRRSVSTSAATASGPAKESLGVVLGDDQLVNERWIPACAVVVVGLLGSMAANVLVPSIFSSAIKLSRVKTPLFRKAGVDRIAFFAAIHPEWAERNGGVEALAKVLTRLEADRAREDAPEIKRSDAARVLRRAALGARRLIAAGALQAVRADPELLRMANDATSAAGPAIASYARALEVCARGYADAQGGTPRVKGGDPSMPDPNQKRRAKKDLDAAQRGLRRACQALRGEALRGNSGLEGFVAALGRHLAAEGDAVDAEERVEAQAERAREFQREAARAVPATEASALDAVASLLSHPEVLGRARRREGEGWEALEKALASPCREHPQEAARLLAKMDATEPAV